MRSAVLTLAIALAVTSAGCATDAADPCTRAADHIAECTGETASHAASDPATCDVDQADSVLAMDCEELAAAAAAGKADGWWDDFLCLLGFDSYCSDSDSGGGEPGTPPPAATRTLTGNVHKVSDGSGAAGVYVRLTREGAPADQRGAWTHAGGLFAVEGLARARYRLEVALAPASGALATTSVDVAAQSYIYVVAPVP